MTRHCSIHNVRRVKVNSDHDALIADIRFHGYRLAGTPVVTVAWINLGNNVQATHRILSTLASMGAQMILVCEARDRWHGHAAIPAWTDARGWRYYRGDHTVTSYETAILMGPAIGSYDGFTTEACPRAYVNGGAGGETDTARFILRVRFTLPRFKLWRRVKANAIPMHLVPSWTWHRSHRLPRAQEQVTALNHVIDPLLLPTIIPGDWNGERRTVMVKLHPHATPMGPRLATKGGWAPDFFMTRAGRR